MKRNPIPSSNQVEGNRKIHPIIIYPFSHPTDERHLRKLYGAIENWLKGNNHNYRRPVTVLNRQTCRRAIEDPKKRASFEAVMEKIVRPVSDVVATWAVDTCQMWLTGFGQAFDQCNRNDIFWLIPGDFHYDSATGEEALRKLPGLPHDVWETDCELCLGEIQVPPNSAKQLIDTYGTYGLLYNWFPAEAQALREITDKPRTEFFAISHDYLRTALIPERWYGYEQTIVLLLQGFKGVKQMRNIHKIALGRIEDDPSSRSTLSGAMQQIERTERVLKLFWRELNEREDPNWPDTFRKLDSQSEQIRGAALVIMQQTLRLN